MNPCDFSVVVVDEEDSTLLMQKMEVEKDVVVDSFQLLLVLPSLSLTLMMEAEAEAVVAKLVVAAAVVVEEVVAKN